VDNPKNSLDTESYNGYYVNYKIFLLRPLFLHRGQRRSGWLLPPFLGWCDGGIFRLAWVAGVPFLPQQNKRRALDSDRRSRGRLERRYGLLLREFGWLRGIECDYQQFERELGKGET